MTFCGNINSISWLRLCLACNFLNEPTTLNILNKKICKFKCQKENRHIIFEKKLNFYEKECDFYDFFLLHTPCDCSWNHVILMFLFVLALCFNIFFSKNVNWSSQSLNRRKVSALIELICKFRAYNWKLKTKVENWDRFNWCRQMNNKKDMLNHYINSLHECGIISMWAQESKLNKRD